MAITETLNVTSSTTSLTTSVGATDRELVKLYHVVASPASISLISSSLYTITGYSDTSQALSIVFDDWTDYVGDSILVVIYTDIDTGNVADAMLTAFGTAANISPTTLQNEIAHVYYIIGQITGGASVADVSLADISNAIARINNLAGKVFASTTTAGLPALWDGTDTLSIGGEDSVEEILTTHESRLDTAEADIAALEATDATHTAQLAGTTSSGLKTAFEASIASLQDQIGSTLGLPAAVASAQAEAADSASPIQVLAVDTLGALEYIDLLAQVKNAPITDTGNYFTTDTVNAALQQLGASLTGGVVWQAGGYFLLERQGGLDPAAAATQYNDPAANTTPIRTGNMDGGTSAHATNWIVMSDTNSNQRMVVFLPTDATGAGYSADDYELSMLECTDTGTGAVRLGTTNIGAYTIEAKSDGSAFYINGVSNAGGPAAAITIKRVRTI